MNYFLKTALLLGSLAVSSFAGGVWTPPAKITKLQVLATSSSPNSPVPAAPVCLVELNGNTNTTYLFELLGDPLTENLFDLLLAAKSTKSDVAVWYDALVTLSSNTQTANGVLTRPQLIAASFNPNP